MGYKAFLVAVDREACTLYKKALDRHLPPEYSAVVISSGQNDKEELARYHLSAEQEKQIRKSFRKPDEQPKILIVTEKLLTGYDAPILYCMYLDKPMRDHVLLQAIARVNRPYEDQNGRRKPAGLILDFVGIFGNLEKALAFDSEDVKGVVEGIEVLKERFEDLMAEGRDRYLPLIKGKSPDKAAEAILDHFRDKEERHAFYQYFRELQDVYEILSPDRFLRPFLEDYGKLGSMHRLLRSYYETTFSVDRSFLRKTAKLVQEYTETGAIQPPEETYRLDEETLQKIIEDNKPDTVKVFNLIKAFRTLIEEEGEHSPHLIPIGERAEQIARAFEERQITTQEALRELTKKGREKVAADKARKESDLSPEGFAVFWILKSEGVAEAETVARKVEEELKRFPHWASSDEQQRELRIKLIKILLDFLDSGVEKVIDLSDNILRMLRRRAR